MFPRLVVFLPSLFLACDLPFDLTTKTMPSVTSPDPTTSSTTPPASDACDLPGYGDGVCDVALGCAAPDIDCFTLFDSDDDAAAWFAGFEAQMAGQLGRPPRTLLTSDDPRWERVRELLDQGWAAYAAVLPVADLRAERPALVLIDDPEVNAFVAPDLETGTAGFAVMVQSGLVDQIEADDGALGVMMHELQHAVGLHVVGDVADQLRTFYLADGREPFGFEQVDDPQARTFGEAWRGQGSAAGPFTDPGLEGFPLGGVFGQFFGTLIRTRTELDPVGCGDPVAAYDALVGELQAEVDPISVRLAVPADLTARLGPVLRDLRDGCVTSEPTEFFDALAPIIGISPDDLRAGFEADTVALLEGEHVVNGMAIVLGEMRGEMRDTESAFVLDVGLPWARLRYYSIEEAADDVTVPVLWSAGLAPDGLGGFLPTILPEPADQDCLDRIAAGDVPPYGDDLTDEHHATCYRSDHIARLAVDPERVLEGGDATAARVASGSPGEGSSGLGVMSRELRRRWLAGRVVH